MSVPNVIPAETTWNEIREKEMSGRYTDSGGDTYWFRKGKLHREDGAAVEYKDGGQAWFDGGMQLASEEAFLELQKQRQDEKDRLAAIEHARAEDDYDAQHKKNQDILNAGKGRGKFKLKRKG